MLHGPAATGTCPLCRAHIPAAFPAFDVDSVPKNRTLAALVDAHRAHTAVPLSEPEPEPAAQLAAPRGDGDAGPRWRCRLSPVTSKGSDALRVGRLRVEVECWEVFLRAGNTQRP